MALKEGSAKTFLRKLQKNKSPESVEMSFIDHLEALRWHLVRAVIAWLVAAIGIFVYIDWIFDNVIYAPARSSFITYSGLCNLSHTLHLGNALCMPPVNIPLQGNTISGPFMSAINIAMVGGYNNSFSLFVLGVVAFCKAGPFAKRNQVCTRQPLLGIAMFLYRLRFRVFFISPFYF